jgi:hypothetical protein
MADAQNAGDHAREHRQQQWLDGPPKDCQRRSKPEQESPAEN